MAAIKNPCGHVDYLDVAVRRAVVTGVNQTCCKLQEDLAEMDAPKYDVDGRKLTQYEAEQEQRANEREIRKWKRKYAALEAAGQDTEEVAAKLKAAEAKQRYFLSQTGLKRQFEREQPIVLTNGKTTGKIKAESASIYANSSDGLYKNAKNIPKIDGYEDIVIHGGKHGFEIRNADDNTVDIYSVVDLCKILSEDPNYHGGAIRLISCEAGAKDSIVAQGMADILGVEVLAPTDIVWVFPDGSMTIGQSAVENTGTWKVFKPKRK